MVYTIIVNSKSYDLPPKTVDVMEKVDEVLKVDSIEGLSVKQKFDKLHKFIKNLVGEENAEEMFGSSNLSEVDLSELTIAVRKVIQSYDKPVADYENEVNKAKWDTLPIDKIISMSKAAQSMANAQMLKK